MCRNCARVVLPSNCDRTTRGGLQCWQPFSTVCYAVSHLHLLQDLIRHDNLHDKHWLQDSAPTQSCEMRVHMSMSRSLFSPVISVDGFSFRCSFIALFSCIAEQAFDRGRRERGRIDNQEKWLIELSWILLDLLKYHQFARDSCIKCLPYTACDE